MNTLNLIRDYVGEGRVYVGTSKIHPGEYLFSVACSPAIADELQRLHSGEIVNKISNSRQVEWRLTGRLAFEFADYVFHSLDAPKKKIVRSWAPL